MNARSILHINSVNQLNNEKRLTTYAEELVAQYGKYYKDQYQLILSNLPGDEQNELARLYIEHSGRDISECVYGNDFSLENDYTCSLLSMLQNNSKENQERFVQITRNNIIKYYSKPLQDILDDACTNYVHIMNNEQGYYAQIHMEHGDVLWSRF